MRDTTYTVTVAGRVILFAGSFDGALTSAVTMARINPIDLITVDYGAMALCTVPHSLTGSRAPPEAYRRPLGLREPIADDCNGEEEPGALVSQTPITDTVEYLVGLGAQVPSEETRLRWYDAMHPNNKRN